MEKRKKDPQSIQKREKFLKSRKKVESMIESLKKNFYFQKFGNCIGDSRTYMFLNELSGKQKRIPIVPALSSDISHTMSDSGKVFDVAETFNNFFVNIGESIQDNIQAPSYEAKIEDVEISFFLTPVGYAELKETLNSLENKSSSGCDNYTNTSVKAIAPATIALLADYINLSSKNGVFPNSLNCANVILSNKNGSKDCVNN